MTFDLIVCGATLPDGRNDIDIAGRDGRIVAIEPNIQAEAGTNIDARGRLVSPPFVDCHFHMDATLSLGLPRLNQSGTLLEGIALWGELKPLLTHEAVAERALRYCDLAVSQGVRVALGQDCVMDPWLWAGGRGHARCRAYGGPRGPHDEPRGDSAGLSAPSRKSRRA